MKSTGLILSLLSGLAFASPTGDHWGPPHHWGGAEKKAVYFLRVDPAGSNVVAIELDSDGKLTDSTSVTSTGGVGLQSQNATSGMTVEADPLQGQQAVSIGGDHLYTINSGSDTVAMFKINPENPLDLQMVGKPMPTYGEFAMSVSCSTKYSKVCVLNGGKVNGVACYTSDPEKGLIPDGVGLREFGYAATTPPVLFGPSGSGSDIQFTYDSSKVITTFKGTNKPMTLGHISVFDVDSKGNVAKKAKDNQVSPLQGPFGFSLDGRDQDQLYISDVNFGGAVVTLDYKTDDISLVAVVNDTAAFAASCWAVWSPVTNMFYNINAGSTNFGVVDPESGALTDIISYDKKLGGGVDTVVDGAVAYFLTGVNVVAVLNLASGKMLQEYTYSDAANRPFWTGMAMYPAEPSKW